MGRLLEEPACSRNGRCITRTLRVEWQSPSGKLLIRNELIVSAGALKLLTFRFSSVPADYQFRVGFGTADRGCNALKISANCKSC